MSRPMITEGKASWKQTPTEHIHEQSLTLSGNSHFVSNLLLANGIAEP